VGEQGLSEISPITGYLGAYIEFVGNNYMRRQEVIANANLPFFHLLLPLLATACHIQILMILNLTLFTKVCKSP
jgi:hypothetical protein